MDGDLNEFEVERQEFEEGLLKPQEEDPSSPPEKRSERINGQEIRVGTVEEFVHEIFGVRLPQEEPRKAPRGLVLGIEKFRPAGRKFFRLIWIGREEAWLAAEDLTEYRRWREAVQAGRVLAAKVGAYFSESSR